MTSIYLPVKALRAMLHLAGKGDVRSYLNGVFVEASPDETCLTATTGEVLGTYRYTLPRDAPRNNAWTGIITRESIKALPKPGKYDPPLCVLSDSSGTFRIDNGAPVAFHDAKFPDYRKIFAAIPAESGAPGQFSVALLASLSKFAHNGLGIRNPTIALRHSGEHVALAMVDGCHDFAAAIMPLRASEPSVPGWVAEAYTHTPQSEAAA